MRVVVDRNRCDSNGLCAATAPGIFTLDADDVLRVPEGRLAVEAWPAAEEAARSCPKLAITLLESG